MSKCIKWIYRKKVQDYTLHELPPPLVPNQPERSPRKRKWQLKKVLLQNFWWPKKHDEAHLTSAAAKKKNLYCRPLCALNNTASCMSHITVQGNLRLGFVSPQHHFRSPTRQPYVYIWKSIIQLPNISAASSCGSIVWRFEHKETDRISLRFL